MKNTAFNRVSARSGEQTRVNRKTPRQMAHPLKSQQRTGSHWQSSQAMEPAQTMETYA